MNSTILDELTLAQKELSDTRRSLAEPQHALERIFAAIRSGESAWYEGQLVLEDALLLTRALARAYSGLWIWGTDFEPYVTEVLRTDVCGLHNKCYLRLTELSDWLTSTVQKEMRESAEIHTLELELRTLVTQAEAYLFSNPACLVDSGWQASREKLISKVYQIYVDLAELERCAPDDRHDLYEWIRANCESLSGSLGGPRLELPDEVFQGLGDPRVVADVFMSRIRSASSNEQRLDLLEKVVLKSARLGAPFSDEQASFIGIFGIEAPNVLRRAASNDDLADRVSAACLSLNTWGQVHQLSGETFGNVWHIISDFTNIVALNGLTRKYVAVSVDRELVERFLDAAISDSDARHEELRKKMASALKLITREIHESGESRINPVGYAARFPWLSYGNLSEQTAVLNPYPNSRSSTHGPPETFRVLFADSSMDESRLVCEVAERSGWRIVLFNSLVPGDELVHKKIMSDTTEARSVAFFCHGLNDEHDYRKSGLFLGIDRNQRECFLTPGMSASLRLLPDSDVIIIACQSGSTNFRLPGAAISNGFAYAGARSILSTLWSIRRRLGSEALRQIIESIAADHTLESSYSSLMLRDKSRYCSLSLQSRARLVPPSTNFD
ncbi:hypothetical protein Gbro_4704 [Gordonia bronchialis DSM 43247]|uniref:CHAT domain-containing protein n=1 Tax=Gordonia bronchialis (strain ATCC 25592 / DSM 43247 / BCRC 13721 / JCM 3198 / KCTC 3076 / NBRC 16047 / NCTC 10667) TaxID=526226 RepID=D0L877_GORB4|nr:CHAT domain-containing protein [Gordonia bronchialis]ACY23825.1 hypothetical protein Gbro_4704 [Gordonia bronchialis DSM 43247]MCC3321990.1 CHAT domain-containing protein [Gordonia bronchialis]QGS22868.1 CHAT domain-containing protein [Gordonia bronchialis]STQ66848.1 CHAT domain [Gordonia bronchialis]